MSPSALLGLRGPDGGPASWAGTAACEAPDALQAPPAIYSSAEFLDIIARVYFPRRASQVLDYAVGGEVFRLLTVAGHGPVVEQTFIDFHQSVTPGPLRPRPLARLNLACRGLWPVEAYRRRVPERLQSGAPAILWRDFPAWTDYLELLRRRKALAEDQRRRRRLVEQVGDLRFQVDDLEGDVLPTAFAWKSARDREAGRPELFAQDAHRAFFHQLRLRGLLRASTLRAEGRLLSIWLGAVHRERWTGWVFTFNPDPSLARYSLGRHLLYDMLAHSHGEGHREFDFSIGLESYKLGFATHVRPLGLAGALPWRDRLKATARHWIEPLRRSRPEGPARPAVRPPLSEESV